MIAFGPVPSRRLGRSLGINNIPPKTCTYSCVYCQLGRTRKMTVQPAAFYPPEEIQKSVAGQLDSACKQREPVDYLTFVSDGEPTLDLNLGREIDLIRSIGIKIAVITNSSLIGFEKVRNNLKKADWVSLKIDAVEEKTWRKIDRPHRSLELRKILEGILEFRAGYKGRLVTETMLVRGLNDAEDMIGALSEFVLNLSPDTVYLSVPTRPPAEKWVQAPDEKTLIRAYNILDTENTNVEYLIGYEGNAFAYTGDVEKDLLSITAVHPMREEAVSRFLCKAKAEWLVIERLVGRGELVKSEYKGTVFFARKLSPAAELTHSHRKPGPHRNSQSCGA